MLCTLDHTTFPETLDNADSEKMSMNLLKQEDSFYCYHQTMGVLDTRVNKRMLQPYYQMK